MEISLVFFIEMTWFYRKIKVEGEAAMQAFPILLWEIQESKSLYEKYDLQECIDRW